MAAISSVGIGSGVLTSDLIDKLVNAEKTPTTNRLDVKEAETTAELSAFGLIQSALTDLRLPARSLADPSMFDALTSSSTNASVSVTTGSTAQSGTYSVEVSALAQSHALSTAEFANSDTTTLGTGTLNITVGTTNAAIIIDNTNNTLDGLASAINGDSALGLNASVLNTGTGFKLVLSSSKSGVDNAIDISVVDSDTNNTDASGLSQLAYTAGALNLTQTQPAIDAALKVNGVAITRSSNTVSDAITGLTLNLSATNVGSPATVTVAQDTDAIVTKVKDFLDKFNALQQTVKDNTKFDPANTSGSGLLLGDSATRTIITQVKNILGSTIKGLESANDRSLSDIGISTDTNTGNLVLDESAFTAQLLANPKDVSAIFADQGRTTDSQVDYVGASVNTKVGTYAVNVTTLATRGTVTGSVGLGASTTVGANNFTFKIDGTTSGSISLTAKAYTQAELATELQAQINKDSALTTAGKSVTVTVDASNQLVISSSVYGSSSTAEITAIDATSATQLGLNVAAGTTGVDVAGSINGVAATGSGQRLSAASGDDSDGLSVDITGGATGSRGNITYIEGIGEQLVDLVNGLLGTNGTVTAKNNRLNSDLSNIAAERVDLTTRTESLRERLVKQFTSADLIVSRLKSTQTFLTSQFASINGTNTK